MYKFIQRQNGTLIGIKFLGLSTSPWLRFGLSTRIACWFPIISVFLEYTGIWNVLILIWEFLEMANTLLEDWKRKYAIFVKFLQLYSAFLSLYVLIKFLYENGLNWFWEVWNFSMKI